MRDIDGRDETAGTWRHKAAGLAAVVAASDVADVAPNARCPIGGMEALAQGALTDAGSQRGVAAKARVLPPGEAIVRAWHVGGPG